MFRHIALFRFSPETERAQREAIVTELRTLTEVIPELVAYDVGFDAGMNEGNYDLAVTADFDDVEGYHAYRDHPAHRRIWTEQIQPAITDRAAVQYAI